MSVSSTTTKNSYSGDGSTVAFAYGFRIFAAADLEVIIRSSAGTETTKTLTTHYSVSGVGEDAGGTVTFVTAPVTGETVVIRRNLTLTQGTDYVENDPFPANSHEDALDRLTFITQGIQEELDRSFKVSKTNTITSTEFTEGSSDRANKLLSFDASGELSVTQEIGTYKGNWSASTSYSVRDLVKDTSTNNIFICVTAHTSSGAQPLTTNTDSAKWDLLVDAASATTSQTAAASSAAAAASSASAAATSESNASSSASSASTSAGTATTKASEASTSAASAAASYDDFDDRYLGAKSAEPSVDNDGDALATGALFFDTTAGAMKVWNGSAWEAAYVAGSGFAATANNLSDLASASSARTNLGLGTAATTASTDYAAVASNLSDLSSASTARTNLGLGDAATKTVGTANGNVIAADATGLPAINGSQVTALNGSNISSGTVAVARLGSGSPGAANFLSGDGTWKEPGGGDELVEEVLITSSSTYATIQPTTGWFDNTYKHLYLWGFGFRPDSNNVDLRVEFGYEDSGQQWNTTANEYFTVAENTRISGGTTGMYTTTSTNVIHHASNDFDAQGDFVQGPIFIDLSWFAQTSTFGTSKTGGRNHPICHIRFGYGEFTSNTNMTNLVGVFGCHEGLANVSATATAWSGIRFAFSSGNVYGAHLFLYGRK